MESTGVIVFLLILIQVFGEWCEKDWSYHGGHCYKKITNTGNDNVPRGKADTTCQKLNSRLTSISNDEERLFLIDLTSENRPTHIYNQTVIGLKRKSIGSPWKWLDGTEFNGSWLEAEPDNTTTHRLCAMLISDPAIWNGSLRRGNSYGYLASVGCGYPANKFVCKKKTCGEKEIRTKRCVQEPPKDGIIEKCENLMQKQNVSIIFIIDSSASIGTEQWPLLVSFVKNAAYRIPSNFRVGFIKFSWGVSEKKWLEKDWSKEEFEEGVPSEYDRGKTNTPAALVEAREMFLDDPNIHKIAILITDGRPYYDGENGQKEELALSTTKVAAQLLRDSGVHLVALGFGDELEEGGEFIKEWLGNPEEDYYFFNGTAKELKKTDMERLLEKACREGDFYKPILRTVLNGTSTHVA